jgi:hypothetical protein
MQTQKALRPPKDAAQARQVYAMGFAPAIDEGFDPYAALDMIREDNAKKLDERAAVNSGSLFVGKIVNDGKLGRIVELDGVRVKLVGYFNRVRWAHIGNLSDWSFREEVRG